jgi:hypothetical protein
LFSVLIYELVGPFLTKVALTKAGDIKAHEKKSAREEALRVLMDKMHIPHKHEKEETAKLDSSEKQ